MELLDRVERGNTWGQLQGFLITRQIDRNKLARWLRGKGEEWLEQAESYRPLGQRLQKLGEIATGELGEVARQLGVQLGGDSVAEVNSPDNVGSGEGSEDGEYWFNRGGKKYQQGDFRGALECFDRFLQLQPNNYKAWVNRGLMLGKLGQLEESLASYDRALQIQSDDYSAWYNRGIVLRNLGQLEEALVSYDRALELQPNDDRVWSNRGTLLAELGKLEEALAFYQVVLQLQPDSPLAWFNRGVVLGELSRLEESLASYDRVWQLQPHNYECWFNRGIVLANLGRLEEALFSYDRALQLQPNDYKVWFNRGIVLKDLGKLEQALASFDRSLQLEPNSYQGWFNRGVMLAQLARLEEALVFYDRVLQIQPDDYRAWVNRGVAAKDSPGYDAFVQQQFVSLLQKDIHKSSTITIKSLEATEPETLIVQFLSSVKASLQLLSQTFPNLNLSLDSQALSESIRADWQTNLERLKDSVREPLSETIVQKLYQDSLTFPSRLNPQLNLRGYEGELASYRAELDKAIRRDTHPEGWGKLHHEIGRAHYNQGVNTSQRYPYWTEAEASYTLALQTLTVANFPKFHLEVLQDLVKVKLGLGKKDRAETLQLQGLEVLKDLYNNCSSSFQRKQLDLDFSGFRQLRVDILIAKDLPKEALTSAELDKNRYLTHILDVWQENVLSPSYQQIQHFLSPTQAIVYWHLSHRALTTFIVKPNADQPIVLPVLFPTTSLEAWLKEWEKNYQDYRGKGKDTTDKQEHFWRKGIKDRLKELKKILAIERILSDLGDVSELILIPHRDLHRLPLHVLFESEEKTWNIAYLPSVQIGISLQARQEPANRDRALLSIENPAKDLEFAEIETAVINNMFDRVSSLNPNSATEIAITKELEQAHQIFHFTGHGYYNSRQPENSALILTSGDNLTAYTIRHLNLNSYELIYLAACETGLTGNQSIESEYVGLVSAFLQAGASCVISTLWTVEEISSAWLTIYFYQRFLAGVEPIRALQEAQQWLKNVTNAELAHWLDNLPRDNIKGNIIDRINDEINAIRQDVNKLNSNIPPYGEYYYWAGFTASGIKASEKDIANLNES